MKFRVRLHVVENTTYNNFVVTMMDGEEWRTIKVVQIIELHLNLRTEKEKKKDKMFFFNKTFLLYFGFSYTHFIFRTFTRKVRWRTCKLHCYWKHVWLFFLNLWTMEKNTHVF